MSLKIIAANWKENPKTAKTARELFKASARAARGRNVQLVICPPTVFVEDVVRAQKAIATSPSRLAVGAQDVFWEEAGPFTGNVGPKMLRSLGLRHVIVGHSERRKWEHESDAMINRKVRRATADGLTAILCVGEPLAVRRRGVAAVEKFVRAQLMADLAGVFKRGTKGKVIVAYEPIWAIGSGMSDNPRDAGRMARFIKKVAASAGAGREVKVLYGGSVTSGNIADYVQLKEMDGALVGGASLKADGFKKLIMSVSDERK